MRGKYCYVYILANKKNGTIYTGVTNNLWWRVKQHKSKKIKGFTSRYNVNKLVYFERFTSIGAAIVKEKNIKNWKRKWKIELIEKDNYLWRDLFDELSEMLF